MEQTREMSLEESYYADSNVVVPIKLLTKCFLDTKRLDKAIYRFIKTQPNLISSVKLDGNRKFFTPLTNLQDYFIILPSDYDWRELCIYYSNNQLLKEMIKCPTPFKIFLIQPSVNVAYFIIVCCHYATDGLSLATSAREIFEIYARLKEDPHFELPSKYQPPPSLEHLRMSVLTESERKSIMSKSKNHHLEIFDSINCTIPVFNEQTAKTVFQTYSSSEQVLTAALSEGRKKELTLGVVLLTAYYFGTAACIFTRQEKLPEKLYLSTEIIINVRGRMVPLEVLPMECASLACTNPLIGQAVAKTSTFWQLARSIQQKIRFLLSEDTKLYMFDSKELENMMDTDDEIQRLEKGKAVNNGLKMHLSFSNMKSYPGKLEHEEFTIDSMYCAGGPWLYGDDILELFVYSTKKLNLTLCHRAGIENEEHAKEVLHYIQHLIENVPTFSQTDITLDEAMKTFPYNSK